MISTELSKYISPNTWDFIRTEAEKAHGLTFEQSAFPKYPLPDELALNIFRFLPPEALGQACRVSRIWNTLGSDKSLWNKFDLKQLFPSLRVIDETVWDEYVDLTNLGLSLNDAPPEDKRSIIPVLKRLFASELTDKESTITILTMPKELTFNKLKELAESPKKGNPTKIFHLNFIDSYCKGLGDELVDKEKTYRVAITSILKGSRNLSQSSQNELAKKIGCTLPGYIPATTLAILTYITSSTGTPIRLYGDNPCTYTRCGDFSEEEVNGQTVLVGNFSEVLGFDVDLRQNYVGEECGASAMFEF